MTNRAVLVVGERKNACRNNFHPDCHPELGYEGSARTKSLLEDAYSMLLCSASTVPSHFVQHDKRNVWSLREA